MGLPRLNRSFHLDQVLIKLISWVDWTKAKPSEVENIDFNEEPEYQEEVTVDCKNDLDKEYNELEDN